MNWLKWTCVEALVLLVAGVALGFGMNAIRGRDSIDLNRDYKPEIKVRKPTATQPAETQAAAGQATERVAEAPAAATEPTEAEVAAEPAGATDEVPFQVVDLEQAAKIWKDPKYDYGLYVFVDARADGPFEAGHVPGALQCDFYRIHEDIDTVVPRAIGAEKVVVYCQGGQCEDSLLVCGELINMDVPWENIYLFKAGWDAWEETDLPIETGPAE